jgi:hypothetical protein
MTQSGQAQIIEMLVELKEDVAGLLAIVPTIQEIDKVVRLGNGKPALTYRMDCAETYIDGQKKKESDKRDYSTKVKLQFIGSLIGFLIVNVGGWVLAYIYLIAPYLQHQ